MKIKENFEDILKLKEELSLLFERRDHFDMLYETERFERLITLNINEVDFEDKEPLHK